MDYLLGTAKHLEYANYMHNDIMQKFNENSIQIIEKNSNLMKLNENTQNTKK